MSASDLSVFTATQILEALFKNTDFTGIANVYVTVYDDTNTELDGSLSGTRAQTAPTDWTVTDTEIANANVIDLGEATSDISNVTDVALFDAATGGNELARYELTDAPFDLADGTQLSFPVGDLQFDVRDRTE